jgi:hypothetical protein
MPGARCTRGPVCKKSGGRTRAYRFSGDTPTFPAQWLYDLLRALPGDQACLTPSPSDMARARPVGPTGLRRLDADHEASEPRDFTVRTAPFVSLPPIAHGVDPALPSRVTPDAAASTASRPASLTIRIRPLVGQDGEGYAGDLGALSTTISENQKFPIWIDSKRRSGGRRIACFARNIGCRIGAQQECCEPGSTLLCSFGFEIFFQALPCTAEARQCWVRDTLGPRAYRTNRSNPNTSCLNRPPPSCAAVSARSAPGRPRSWMPLDGLPRPADRACHVASVRGQSIG